MVAEALAVGKTGVLGLCAGLAGASGTGYLVLVPLIRHLVIEHMLRVAISQELPPSVLRQGRHVTLHSPRLPCRLLLGAHPLLKCLLVLLVLIGASELIEDHRNVVTIVVVVIVTLVHRLRDIVARRDVKSARRARGG